MVQNTHSELTTTELEALIEEHLKAVQALQPQIGEARSLARVHNMCCQVLHHSQEIAQIRETLKDRDLGLV